MKDGRRTRAIADVGHLAKAYSDTGSPAGCVCVEPVRRLSVLECTPPATAKELYQTQLYLREHVPEYRGHPGVRPQNLQKDRLELGQIGRLTKINPASGDETTRDRVRLPDPGRQGFELIPDFASI